MATASKQASGKKAGAAKAGAGLTTARKAIPANPQGIAKADGLPIELTHPDKSLDTETGVTKRQLAQYYLAIAERMFPHIAGRPLTLVRCLDGSGHPCFYQKHKNEKLGAGFSSVDVVNIKTGGKEPYITVSATQAIAEFAQIDVLEVHPWGSRNEALERPDRIIIDLDPDAAIEWTVVAATALEARSRLEEMGLQSFVKTTGGKGLHVVAPVRPGQEWPRVKQFAHDLVLAMERDSPELFVTKMNKSARAGKIFLDYLRNDRGATAVAPYSPRARAGLPVAMPLGWSELDGKYTPRFRVSDLDEWKERLARDPWKEMLEIDQRLQLS